MVGQSKADATPLLLFLNFDVMFAILYFSLNLDKGAWPRKISKIRVLFYGPNRRSRYFQIKIILSSLNYKLTIIFS